ncbi:EAL domain-containing protein [Novosphingobium sp. KN65.2]|uniref:bifunctional diguanylate cyclase/phosphodiesterase n=1 Tax=Novosphingobium sp. KN65.2 TaxID=1478134 RepID=UPI0005E089FC|nr:EAL domain-containing protein [Novosphingobium sp. KN65.2]CDO35312.1 Periplasmic sensor diguanylate cyclase/phosphodiesterase [Novosphingobium sp. KN65.2]
MSGQVSTPLAAKRPVHVLGPSIVFAFLAVVILIVGLLVWSGHEVDRVASDRDRALAQMVLEESIDRLGHVQESSTIWDDAVEQVRKRPLDLDWIDINLGTWFHEYAGMNEVYILSPSDRPIYAMRDGKRIIPENFIAVEDIVAPMVAELRKNDKTRRENDNYLAMLSPGVSDLAVLRGRPAIVSVKPIIGDSGKIVQKSGTEAIHVGIVYLDKDYFNRIGSNYGLNEARYVIVPGHGPNETSIPLQSRTGNVVGYMVWHPFKPGYDVTSSVGPVLLAVLILAGAAIYLLASRLARRTQDLEQSRSLAQHQAMHDALTGLANRAMFEARLESALARCRRHNSLLALLYIDLDQFKQVNDSLGHPAGDMLIRQVAHRLSEQIRSYDTVARLGGDEFAILLDEPENRAAVERACARIIAELERPFELTSTQAFIGGSIGVALAPHDTLDRTELTRKADIALYQAKLDGRGRYVFFAPSMDEDVRQRETINRELRSALADCDSQLRLHYQPIYSLESGRIVAVEALLRWEHPQNGLVTPDAFIRTAEETGHIEVLGDWVLRKAMHDARAWPGLRISVNVSPIQVRSRVFRHTVKRILAETGIEPTRLELELTETALMSASSDVAESLRSLRSLGVACALDDFGTGYSSLSHIRDIAVDRIKIDRSFVHAVGTVPGAALVEAIVSLASANGLHLTAEGVETLEQLTFLRSVGCHEVQGYYMAQPVAAKDVTELLQGQYGAGRIADILDAGGIRNERVA